MYVCMYIYIYIYIYIHKNNLKIMKLKRKVGIDRYHCYKNKEKSGKRNIHLPALLSKETRWNTCICQYWKIYLANG